MISPDHVWLMARYNQWQNRSLYTAADGLTDDARRQDRGAFFGSIHETLSHLLWGDMIWMHRFDAWEKPALGIKDSSKLYRDWEALKLARIDSDEKMIDWAKRVSPDWLALTMTWFSGAAGREVTKDNWFLVTHLFNHQTHHRGQVHAMLTAAGAKPADTDLFYLEADNTKS
jgi:uncharacterized damage-inducible protein DinB